jgi:hypothetical protein
MPGNIAELRPLIFIAAFVGMALLLVGLMITESPTLFVGATPGSALTPTNSPNPLNLMAWNTSVNFLASASGYQFTFAGYNVEYDVIHTSDWNFQAFTYASFYFIQWDTRFFSWYNSQNELESTQLMSLTAVNSDYTTGGTNNIKYTWKNDLATIPIQFSFNTSKYDSPIEAYNDGALYVLINSAFASANSGFNALSFIAGLFTFSLPGMPSIINAIIWLMIFPGLGYLAFIFVIKIIGAIFGGG